jgi:hypothetical protein
MKYILKESLLSDIEQSVEIPSNAIGISIKELKVLNLTNYNLISITWLEPMIETTIEHVGKG